ncbi:MAG: DUF4292 domain-containing protein [Deltaproteobacteria bacterium]|nr:DUF4292 domain-containing protein [Deltaproteobacteria bacterium]
MRPVSVVIALGVAAVGCSGTSKGGGTAKAPSTLPTGKEVVAKLEAMSKARTSFSAATVMDYWLGQQRLKGEVLVMGTDKRQVRFNANDPAGLLIADMGCNGQEFAFKDMRNNCQLTGPCNQQSIARFLRVELEPDDFLHFALGTPPVDPSADGTVVWDAKRGAMVATLTSPEGTQKLVIDNQWDVLSSELVDKSGKVVWSVEQSDFKPYKDGAGVEHRLPGLTRFKSPRQEADLKVEWKERVVNPTLAASKFVVPMPEGLPQCTK